METEEVTWIELDDGILDHPKFVRAVAKGGGDVVHLWLGLRAYCSKNLSNGLIPSDMIDDVRGPRDPEKRATALAVLREVKLLDEHADGVAMHNYLKWSSSRREVLDRRKKARERKARSREESQRDGQRDGDSDYPVESAETPDAVTNPRGRVPPPLPHPDPNPDQDRPVSGSNGKRNYRAEAAYVFEAWKQDTGHSKAKLDGKRETRIIARLKEDLSKEELALAITKRRNFPFLMGQGKGSDGTVYDGIETLLRDRGQVEKLLFSDEGNEAIQWEG